MDRSERTSGAALIEALIVTLTLAEQESSTPPALGGKLAELVARAEAALLSVREIAHGIYPSALAAFGLLTALRAQARRAPVDVNVDGIASRSTEDAEIGVYFSCLEAIQNVAKHAGRGARVTLQCQHHDGRLVVRIADDGDGFDPASTPDRGGLSNIRDRVQSLGGTLGLTSHRGAGTELALSVPWPPRQPNAGADTAAGATAATSRRP